MSIDKVSDLCRIRLVESWNNSSYNFFSIWLIIAREREYGQEWLDSTRLNSQFAFVHHKSSTRTRARNLCTVAATCREVLLANLKQRKSCALYNFDALCWVLKRKDLTKLKFAFYDDADEFPSKFQFGIILIVSKIRPLSSEENIFNDNIEQFSMTKVKTYRDWGKEWIKLKSTSSAWTEHEFSQYSIHVSHMLVKSLDISHHVMYVVYSHTIANWKMYASKKKNLWIYFIMTCQGLFCDTKHESSLGWRGKLTHHSHPLHLSKSLFLTTRKKKSWKTTTNEVCWSINITHDMCFAFRDMTNSQLLPFLSFSFSFVVEFVICVELKISKQFKCCGEVRVNIIKTKMKSIMH